MNNLFFEKTKDLKESIKGNVEKTFQTISDKRIKKILMQRTKSSSFIKGIVADCIHCGLEGKFDNDKRIDFASALEIYSGGLVILDNIIDKHYVRNGKTTYLKEFGPEINALASQYSTHLGLIKMAPYLGNFIELCSKFPGVDEVINGAIKMDLDLPKNLEDVLESICSVNGATFGMPLAIAATTATDDELDILDVFQYGYNAGIAFGIYEEVRDLVGQHGREKASELKRGRIPLIMFLAAEKDKNFCPKEYSGRPLSDKEFKELFYRLKENGAIKETKNMIQNYFDKSQRNIQEIIKKEKFETLNLLRKDIENSYVSFTNSF